MNRSTIFFRKTKIVTQYIFFVMSNFFALISPFHSSTFLSISKQLCVCIHWCVWTIAQKRREIFFLCLKNRITLNSNKKKFSSYYKEHKYIGFSLAQFMNTSFQLKWHDKSIYQYNHQWHWNTFLFSNILGIRCYRHIFYIVSFLICVSEIPCFHFQI